MRLQPNTRHFIFSLIGLFMLTSSCDVERKIKNEDLVEGRKQREIRKISDVEIDEATYLLGSKIASQAQATFGKALTQAVTDHGLLNAISFCKSEAQGITDSLSENLHAVVRRTSLKVRNPKNKPSDYEMQLLDAYQYNFEQGLKLEDNVQVLPGEQLLYTKPILVAKPLCLNCHGNNIPQAVSDKLSELYPKDSATGYNLGDFRGIWSVRFKKKDIILSMD